MDLESFNLLSAIANLLVSLFAWIKKMIVPVDVIQVHDLLKPEVRQEQARRVECACAQADQKLGHHARSGSIRMAKRP